MRITPMGNIGVGDFSGTDVTVLGQPQAKMDIYNSFALQEYASNGLRVRNLSEGVNTTANAAFVVDMNTTGGAAGVQQGVQTTATGGYKIHSGYFRANAVAVTGDNFGVLGESYGLNTGYINGNANSGIVGAGFFGESAFGVRGSASSGDLRNIAIYGRISSNDPNPWAGWFEGKTWCTQGIWSGSDATLKENVQPVVNALEIVNALPVYSYSYTSSAQQALNFDSGPHIGILAQDLEQVLPQLVTSTLSVPTADFQESVDFKSVNYLELIPVLIGAVQELHQENDSLKQMINDCCTLVAGQEKMGAVGTTHEVKLSNRTVTLGQNAPNPFAERTEIRYAIDKLFSRAEILFYDQSGRLIEMVEITEGGEGSIVVFSEDLSSGKYSYALVVDGEVIDTKQMVRR